jgi:hypothetical protein
VAVLVPRNATARGSCRAPAAIVFALALAGAAPAHAGAVPPLDEGLARAFPGARIEKRTLALSLEDVSAVEARAHTRCEPRLVTAYVAWRGDTLAGAAWTDRRVIRTREAVLLLAVAPDTSLVRVDVLAFFEPLEYVPPSRWLALFRGRGSRKPLTPQRSVPVVAGVTLSSRAVNESARLALAWYEVLLAPQLAGHARDAAAKRASGGGQP